VEDCRNSNGTGNSSHFSDSSIDVVFNESCPGIVLSQFGKMVQRTGNTFWRGSRAAALTTNIAMWKLRVVRSEGDSGFFFGIARLTTPVDDHSRPEKRMARSVSNSLTQWQEMNVESEWTLPEGAWHTQCIWHLAANCFVACLICRA